MNDPFRRRIGRRDFLRSAGALGVGALAGPAILGGTALGARRYPDPRPARPPAALADGRLRVGYLPITDASPLLLAHALGLYAAEGLEVERPTLFRGWAPLAEAFQAGVVDVAHFLMPMTFWMRFSVGVPATVVAWDHTGGSALTVADRIDAVEDLAGATVAVPFWYSVHNVILQILLEQAGLTPLTEGDASADEGSVKLVVMAPPDMPPALANGSIAGYIVADPFNAVAEVNAIGKVLRFTGDVWLDHACCVVTVADGLVDGAPDVTQALVTAVARAQLFANEERVEAARILSDAGEGYLPQPLPAIQRALTHYDHAEYTPSGAIRHPDWPTGRIDFQPFPFPSYTQRLWELATRTEVEGEREFLESVDPSSVHDDLVDERFARAAIETLGGPAAFGLPDDLSREETIDP
ncbi:ABC transporter substrate-binding protein [soil metagenome]